MLRTFFRRICCAIFVLLANVDLSSAEDSGSLWILPNGKQCQLEILAPLNRGPINRDTQLPVAFYLKGLQTPRVGTVGDQELIDRLRNQGLLVVVIDFHGDDCTRFPHIHATLGKLRTDLHSKKLLADRIIDTAKVYLVPEGSLLERDIEFYRDGNRVLAMDLIYPAKPNQLFGTLIEFSCDNLNRFGNGSLAICGDTLLDGLATQGFAICMADHPVAPPYKGIDPMPACAERIRAAVRVLRHRALELGASSKIVPVGFSRGSGMAMLLTTNFMADEYSKVDGAIVLSGRFTYLDLLKDDKMIPRYEKAWGTKEENLEVWRAHGAVDKLDSKTVPLFLSINASESPDALHQMEVLKSRLDSANSTYEFMLENEPRGHKVPIDFDILLHIASYLRTRLM